jgi:hypothetical protein
MSPDIEMSMQMAVSMTTFEALVRKPHVKMMEYEKSQMTKVLNYFKSDVKGIIRLVLQELRKLFRYKVSASLRNRVRNTIRV